MAYVKISDPNIIDLSAWQEVIHVVNQHSDSLSAITDNFGSGGSSAVNWNGGTDIKVAYTMGAQKIIYGRTYIDFDTSEDYTLNKNLFYGTVAFAGSTGSSGFSAKPIITVTVQYTYDTLPSNDDTANTVCTLYDVTSDSFSYRIMNPRSVDSGPRFPLTGHAFINWTAIGPK